MPPPPLDSSTVAIPWFNNIWLNDTPTTHTTRANRVQPPSNLAQPAAPPSAPVPSSAVPGSYSHAQSRQSVQSSSRLTISTMSAVDRVSLCSLPSTATARCSAQDILRTLSDSNSSDFLAAPIPHPPVAVSLADPDTKLSLQMRLLQLHAAGVKDRAVRVASAANVPTSSSTTGKPRATLLQTR